MRRRLRQGDRQRGFPGRAGRAADARDRRQGGGLPRGAAPAFRDYCAQILANARALARGVGERGFRIVSGGTDTHLFLLSLVDRDITGKAAQVALERAGITANKNMVPFDPRKPAVTSGVRIGTPAVTTRGMREAEMAEIAALIARALERPGDVEAPRRDPRRGRGAVPPLPALPGALERRRLSRALSLLLRRRRTA